MAHRLARASSSPLNTVTLASQNPSSPKLAQPGSLVRPFRPTHIELPSQRPCADLVAAGKAPKSVGLGISNKVSPGQNAAVVVKSPAAVHPANHLRIVTMHSGPHPNLRGKSVSLDGLGPSSNQSTCADLARSQLQQPLQSPCVCSPITPLPPLLIRSMQTGRHGLGLGLTPMNVSPPARRHRVRFALEGYVQQQTALEKDRGYFQSA
jgi:hypothetical protein